MENAASKPVALVLVAGGFYQDRETWIASDIAASTAFQSQQVGVLLEGLPSGQMPLQGHRHLRLERIAPGCFCCIGNIAMRVSLNRLLRQKIDHLYVAINQSEHLSSLRQFLQQDSYADFFKSIKVIHLT